MLLVMFLLGLCTLIISIVIGKIKKMDFDSPGLIAPIMSSVIIIISSFMTSMYVTAELVELRPIEQKIEYLTQNNLEIEAKISQSIKDYCEYEGKTYIEVAPENPAVIFIAYPELKADELFKSYLDTLQTNNDEIRKLKLKTFNASVIRWWLYFGK